MAMGKSPVAIAIAAGSGTRRSMGLRLASRWSMVRHGGQ